MKKRIGVWLLAAVIGVLIAGCAKHEADLSKQEANAPQANVDKLDKKIEGPVTARSQDLSTILQTLQQDSGLTFVLDSGVNAKATFSLDDPTIRTVLDTILPVNGLSYAAIGADTVRIGRTETLASAGLKPMPDVTPVPAPAVNARFLEKRIEGPVMAKDQDLKNILQILQGEGKVQMVIQEGVSAKVTFALENPTIREVLDAALQGTGLEYVIRDDGILHVQRKK